MMQYLFDLIAILVAAVIIFIFAKRGFFKSILRFFRWIFATLMAYLFGSKLATFFYDKVFYQSILKSLTEKVQALYDSATASFNGEAVYEKLPFFLKTEEMREKLAAIESGDGMVSAISETIAKPVSTIAANVAGYLLVFIVAFLAFWVALILLDKIVKLTAFTRFVNGLLGACLGAALALLLLVMAVSIMRTFFSETPVYANSFLVKWISSWKLLQNDSIFNVGKRWLSGIR